MLKVKFLSGRTLHFLKGVIFICIALIQVLFSGTVMARGASDLEFIKLDTTLRLNLVGMPSYMLDEANGAFPASNAFNEINSADDEQQFLSKTAKKAFWIRLELDNTLPVNQEAVIRIFGYGDQIKVIREYNGIQTDLRFSETMKNPNYFFPGGKLILNPGRNVVFLHFRSAWGKYGFSFDVVNEKETLFDRAIFYNDSLDMIIVLFAFLFLIAFQLLYVALQYYFHKRREYLEYFFYLLLIGIYFSIRLDVIMCAHVLSSIHIQIVPVLNEITLILPYTFYLRFSRYFIGMSVSFPKIENQIKKVEWINTLFILPILALHFAGLPKIAMIASTVFILLLFGYTLWLIQYFYIRRNTIIRFLLAGSLCAATGHALAMTVNLVPGFSDIFQFPPFYFTMIGLIFEIYFFNTGLGYKGKYEQVQRLKAQSLILEHLHENQKIEDKLHGMRDIIANDLHDDLGSTLSSIGLYSQVAIKEIDTGKETNTVKEILQKISNSSQRMMEAMSEIVWAIHSKNDAGEELVTRIKNIASERLAHSGIKFSIESVKMIDAIQFTMEARRNITLLFKEAINNSAKHSGANQIKCDLKMKGEQLVIQIIDDGSGFDQNTKSSGNGRSSMENRVNSLKGSFSLISSPNHGTQILIYLPLNEISLGFYNNIT